MGNERKDEEGKKKEGKKKVVEIVGDFCPGNSIVSSQFNGLPCYLGWIVRARVERFVANYSWRVGRGIAITGETQRHQEPRVRHACVPCDLGNPLRKLILMDWKLCPFHLVRLVSNGMIDFTLARPIPVCLCLFYFFFFPLRVGYEIMILQGRDFFFLFFCENDVTCFV